MKSRDESLQIAALREFDLLVVGGGIAGAGIAQNAASRGLSVMLIEKDDFASGTSSRTTKLIHGGLRYLEQLKLKLTSQLCQERALLERLAPHMVRDLSFILPLSRHHRLFNLRANLGLALYDMVAWSAGARHHCQHLSAHEVARAAPALSTTDILGGLMFHDCITDDARLVLAVIKSACQEGGVALNYVEARAFVESENQIVGATCRDRVGGREFDIRAKTVVNASGIWCDRVGQLSDPNWTKRITASKGIHIIVPASAFETNSGLFLPTDDNRYVFVVPWQRAVMIGTTDRQYSGDPDNPLPALDEIDYLLSVVNGYSASRRLNRSDVSGTFAGLRPLVKFETGSDGTDTASMSREHLTFESAGGLINVAGGKLTSYRLMAQEAVDKALNRLPTACETPDRTGQLMLGGFKDKQDFLNETAAISTRGKRLGLDPAVIDHLIATYGAEAQAVLELLDKDPALAEHICADFPPVMAEVVFSVRHEMAVCLEDLLMRRLRLGILNHRQTLICAPKVAQLMQKWLGWDTARLKAELSSLVVLLDQHMDPLAQAAAKEHG